MSETTTDPAPISQLHASLSRLPAGTLRAGLLAVALLACVVRLGSSMYWQDEALTALLGRTIRQTGLPAAWDGRNLVHDRNYPRNYNEDLVWVGHPWLPFYIVAGAQALGGPSPWAGRLPFALSGWLALVLLYPAGVRVLGSRRAALWALVAGVASVPFYLYTRQCQYYPLLMLAAVLLWWGLALAADHPRGGWLIAGGLLMLVYSNPATLVGVIPACVLAAARHWRDRRVLARYAVAGAVAALGTVPYVLYAQLWRLYGAHHADKLPIAVRAVWQSWRLLWEANLWVFPVAAAPLVLWAMWPRSDAAASDSRVPPRVVGWLTLDAILLLGAVGGIAPWPHFRYVLPLLPLGFWVTGAVLARAQARHAVLAGALAVTLLGTRAWHTVGHRAMAAFLDTVAPQGAALPFLTRLEPRALAWTTDHLEFLYELTHTYRGPVDALVRFFEDHAEADQTVAITYPQEPIALLTNLRLVKRIPDTWPEAARLPAYVSTLGTPDWIVVRSEGPTPLFDPAAFFQKHGGDYLRYQVAAHDATWNNRPYPLVHRYRAPDTGPPLIVYGRAGPAPAVPPASAASRPVSGAGVDGR